MADDPSTPERKAPAGWYDDPEVEGGKRYWDGSQWTDQRQAPKPPSAIVANYRRILPSRTARIIFWIATPIVVIIVLAGIFGETPEDQESNGAGSGEAQTSEPEATMAEEVEESPEPSPADQVSSAVEDVDGPVEDPEVSDVQVNGKFVTATVQTPEGGLEGASTQDVDWMAGAVFADIYDEAEFQGDAVLTFRGGLADTRTGEDLPNAPTARYAIKQAEAKRIEWSDEETIVAVIDWSLYRDFAHPALKQD